MDADWEIGPPCIDSRICEPGDLFWGLIGKRDGGEFAPESFSKGAQAAVVNETWAQKISPGKPLVVVKDTLKAMTDLAKIVRDEFRGRVFALTGSCGKTTAKDLIAAVLAQKFKVLKSPASYNNHIGIPFTLCRLNDEYDMAVLEMGANHPGEIAGLCETAKPDSGLITMVGRAHLEGFGSMAGVASAKGELFGGLTGDKIAFVNFDDPYVVGQSTEIGKRIGYGFRYPPPGQGFARIYRGIVNEGRGFTTLNRNYHFPHPGYMMIHGLAAVAVGHFHGVPPGKMVEALKSFSSLPGRMRRIERGGVILYDDTYNSNPSSLKAALEFTAGISGGRKFAVLGDMMELGEFSNEEHKRAVKLCHDLKFHRVLTLGDNFSAVQESDNFTERESLMEEIHREVKPGDVILFKGSRAVKMEEILEGVIKRLKGD